MKKRLSRMTLTKNEKVLLILLSVIIIFSGAYKFIIEPQSIKLESLKKEKEEYKGRISEKNDLLMKEGQLSKKWNDLKKQEELMSYSYFSELNQAEILYFLDTIFTSEEIEILDINFTMVREEEPSSFIKLMDVSIPYRGSYEGIMDTMENIALSSKKLKMINMTIDKGEESLVGEIILRAYSIEGLATEIKEEHSIIALNQTKDGSPFGSKEEELEDDLGLEDLDQDEYELFIGGESLTPENIDVESAYKDTEVNKTKEVPILEKKSPTTYVKESLLDLNQENSLFLPSHTLVRGKLGESSVSKFDNTSLKFEYNVLAVEEENRAYIDISKNQIILKYPPSKIGLWTYSYDYSPANLGIRFLGQLGEIIDLDLTKGIGWTGWKYIEVAPPEDLDLYPLRINNLYLEISEGRQDFGVLLLDDLEASYKRNTDEKDSCKYIYHIVKEDESIESISQSYYGTEEYKEEILKENEIHSKYELYTGKILLIKKIEKIDGKLK